MFVCLFPGRRLLIGFAAGTIATCAALVARSAYKGLMTFGPIKGLESSEEFRETVGLLILAVWLAFTYGTQLCDTSAGDEGSPVSASDPAPPMLSPAEHDAAARSQAKTGGSVKKAPAGSCWCRSKRYAWLAASISSPAMIQTVALAIPVMLGVAWYYWIGQLHDGKLDVPGHCSGSL